MNKRKFLIFVLLCLSSGVFNLILAKSHPPNSIIPTTYNVIWNSPSPDAWESMPLSGRDGAGADVWVQDGSVWIYMAHNGAYDEQARFLKLGYVRLTPKDVKLEGAGYSFRK